MFSNKCRTDSKYIHYYNVNTDIYEQEDILQCLQNPPYSNKIFFTIKNNLWDTIFSHSNITQVFLDLAQQGENAIIERDIDFIYQGKQYNQMIITLRGFNVAPSGMQPIYDYKVTSIEYGKDTGIIFSKENSTHVNSIQLLKPNDSD